MRRDDDIASAETAVGTAPGPAPGPVASDAPPTLVADRYEVQSLLGVGGMGRVYRAHDRALDESVALKLLRRELLDTPGVLERFRQEVKLARRVTHANVVRTFDLGTHGADHFLTMELVDGRSLARLLDDGLLPLPEVLRIARAACAGMAAAHTAGVLHRDLKPDNVLVAKTGRVAITDFGIAQVGTDPERPVETFVGTPAYMAPEQVEGKPFGPSGDVYAFGAILFEMVTGRRPFTGHDAFSVAHARLTQPPPDPRDHGELPPALAQLIVCCLAREPERRIADGNALATALAAPEMQQPTSRPAPAAPAAVPGRTSRSVALMPLRGGADLAEIADGLTEEIIDALTMTRELRVRPLASVRTAAASERPPEVIGRELGVDVIVDGSVRRRGDAIRIAARAIGTTDGFLLWANHVDTPPSGLLTAGDDVARAIARALTVELEMPARASNVPRATELYLESKARLRQGWTTGRIDDALAGLEEAAALAPDDPNIIAALSMALARSAFYGLNENLPRAESLAVRAVTLAPASGDTQLALGLASLYDGRVPDAARAFARAVTVAPGHAFAQGLFGAILLEADALAPAYEHLDAAYTIDPMSTAATDLARLLVYQGRESELPHRVPQIAPSAAETALFTARFAMWRGQTHTIDLPRDNHRVIRDMTNFFDFATNMHATRSLRPGDRELLASETLVRNARLRATRSQFAAEYMMFVGDHDAAMEYVDHSVAAGLQDVCWLDRCPLLAPLRTRSDFARAREIVAGRAREVIAAIGDVLVLPH